MSSIMGIVISSMVDYLVSSAIPFLGSKLHSFEGKQILAETNRWKLILEDLNGFLQHAEDSKHKDRGVSRWLENLEEWIYDAEDIVAEFNYEALRLQLTEEQEESSGLPWSYIWKASKKPRKCWPNSDMAEMVMKISERLQSLKDAKMGLNLLEVPIPFSTNVGRSRHDSVSLPTAEPLVLGRDDDKRKVIRILLNQQDDHPSIGVVSIVGMGGLGKTTLARHIYNDPRVVSCFDVRGWVCVTGDYDTKRISKELLESVSGNLVDVKDVSLDWVQLKLRDELRNKKFLLVLDDIWNDSYADWHSLRTPFLEGSIGSRIIVTTRSHYVSDTVRTMDCIFPSPLSDDDCWSLLRTHAELDPRGDLFSMLEAMGRKIAVKCSGLPLAAMTVGGLLRNKFTVEQWETILNSKSWILNDGHLDVISVLKMSYDDLDPQLKRCFSFLALFPEDCEFKEDDVVLIWVGAGLIQAVEEEKRKQVGHDYFQKLLANSLISFSATRYYNGVQHFVMHDLVRELARQVFGRDGYIAQDDNLVGSFQRSRHLSFHRSRFESIVNDIVNESKTPLPLRTFLPLKGGVGLLPPRYLDDLFLRLKYVRVLSLPGLGIKELPESIGQLILLRYLNVSGSHIQRLPTSFTSLYNLQILILYYCEELEQLPENIGTLINLFHLDITGCYSLKELPAGVEGLSRLRELSNFIIGKNLSLSALGNLKLLEGRLEISCLENVSLPEDARLAQLYVKKLDELELGWPLNRTQQPIFRNQAEMNCDQEILEQLQPQENLKILRVYNYGGSTLPSWLAGTLKQLQVLSLIDCWNCCELNTMASLIELEVSDCPKMSVRLHRMPFLKRLSIIGCKKVEYIEPFSFYSLETLYIGGCPSQKVLLPYGDFPPSLTSVEISDCKRLVSFSQQDTFPVGLHTLRILNCPRLVSKFPKVLHNLTSITNLSLSCCSYAILRVVLRLQLPNLRELNLLHCKKIVSFLAEDTEIDFVPLTQPVNRLSISYFPELKMLSSLQLMSSLFSLTVSECRSLESFQDESLPRSIKFLHIRGCPLLAQKIQDHDQLFCSKISHIHRIILEEKEILL